MQHICINPKHLEPIPKQILKFRPSRNKKMVITHFQWWSSTVLMVVILLTNLRSYPENIFSGKLQLPTRGRSYLLMRSYRPLDGGRNTVVIPQFRWQWHHQQNCGNTTLGWYFLKFRKTKLQLDKRSQLFIIFTVESSHKVLHSPQPQMRRFAFWMQRISAGIQNTIY